MIRDAVAVELGHGQVVIISGYSRGTPALPIRAALITVLGGPDKVVVGVNENEIAEIITALTRQLVSIQRNNVMDRKDAHKNNVAGKMAAESTREGRNRVALNGTVAAIRAIKTRLLKQLDDEIEAELTYMSEHVEEIVQGVEHGLNAK